MSDSPLFALFLIAIVFLTGAFLAATPWLMKKSECFTVTVPEFAQTDWRFRSFRVRYTVSVLAATLACSVAMGVASYVYASSVAVAGSFSVEVFFVAVVVAASIVPAIVSFALMLFYRKKVQAVKAEEGWRAEHSESAAVVGFEEVPKPPSLAWNAVYVPIVLATLAIGLAVYPTLPDVVPLHMDFAGNVDSGSRKALRSSCFPCCSSCSWLRASSCPIGRSLDRRKTSILRILPFRHTHTGPSLALSASSCSLAAWRLPESSAFS